MDSDAERGDLHFHLEILAPRGLRGIEPFLPDCTLPVEAHVSGFDGQTILRHAGDPDAFEFDMDLSTGGTMHASGDLYLPEEVAWGMLLSLSIALSKAGFPHVLGMDVRSAERYHEVGYRCRIDGKPVWQTG